MPHFAPFLQHYSQDDVKLSARPIEEHDDLACADARSVGSSFEEAGGSNEEETEELAQPHVWTQDDAEVALGGLSLADVRMIQDALVKSAKLRSATSASSDAFDLERSGSASTRASPGTPWELGAPDTPDLSNDSHAGARRFEGASEPTDTSLSRQDSFAGYDGSRRSPPGSAPLSRNQDEHPSAVARSHSVRDQRQARSRNTQSVAFRQQAEAATAALKRQPSARRPRPLATSQIGSPQLIGTSATLTNLVNISERGQEPPREHLRKQSSGFLRSLLARKPSKRRAPDSGIVPYHLSSPAAAADVPSPRRRSQTLPSRPAPASPQSSSQQPSEATARALEAACAELQLEGGQQPPLRRVQTVKEQPTSTRSTHRRTLSEQSQSQPLAPAQQLAPPTLSWRSSDLSAISASSEEVNEAAATADESPTAQLLQQILASMRQSTASDPSTALHSRESSLDVEPAPSSLLPAQLPALRRAGRESNGSDLQLLIAGDGKIITQSARESLSTHVSTLNSGSIDIGRAASLNRMRRARLAEM